MSSTSAASHSGRHAGKIDAGSVSASRLDDGKSLLAKAAIGERQAIAAGQSAASGALNEVDLEYAGGQLVFTVDVRSHDVKRRCQPCRTAPVVVRLRVRCKAEGRIVL